MQNRVIICTHKYPNATRDPSKVDEQVAEFPRAALGVWRLILLPLSSPLLQLLTLVGPSDRAILVNKRSNAANKAERQLSALHNLFGTGYHDAAWMLEAEEQAARHSGRAMDNAP